MLLAPYLTNNTSEYRSAGFQSTVGGTVVIVLAHMLGVQGLVVQPFGAHQPVPRLTFTTPAVLNDTHHSSTIREGQLRNGSSTLIGEAARTVIGDVGVNRLENFFNLQAGWDGPKSRPISLESVEVLSRFFAETGLQPKEVGVFMSAQGNVVVNWLDREGKLIELEFLPSAVEYFFERTGEEGNVLKGDIGFTKLRNLIAEINRA